MNSELLNYKSHGCLFNTSSVRASGISVAHLLAHQVVSVIFISTLQLLFNLFFSMLSTLRSYYPTFSWYQTNSVKAVKEVVSSVLIKCFLWCFQLCISFLLSISK